MAGLRARYPAAQAWTFICDGEGVPEDEAASAPRGLNDRGNTRGQLGEGASSKPWVKGGETRRRFLARDVHAGAIDKENTGAALPPGSSRGTDPEQAAGRLPNADPLPAPGVPEKRGRVDDLGTAGSDYAAVVAPPLSDPGMSAVGPFPLGGGSDEDENMAWLSQNLGVFGNGLQRPEDLRLLARVPWAVGGLRGLVDERAGHLSALDSLSHQTRRQQHEIDQRTQEKKSLGARLEASEQEVHSLEQRLAAVVAEHRTERGHWASHRQELETRCVQLEHRDTQYKAAVRKKETEYHRLQESMQRKVNKEHGAARGADVSFGLPARKGGPPTAAEAAAAAGGPDPLARLVSEAHEQRANILAAENESLRGMLGLLQEDLGNLQAYQDRHSDLLAAQARTRPGFTTAAAAAKEVTPEQVDGMPADWLRSHLGDQMARQALAMQAALRRVLGEEADEGGQEEGGAGAGEEGWPEEARERLRECHALLQQQDDIIHAAVFNKPGVGGGEDGDGGEGDASVIWEMRERLEREREELAAQRRELEEDRAQLLEEAARFDAERFSFSLDAGAMGDGGDLHHVGTAGTLMASPAVPRSPGLGFTPPKASPATARLLWAIGIVPGEGGFGAAAAAAAATPCADRGGRGSRMMSPIRPGPRSISAM